MASKQEQFSVEQGDTKAPLTSETIFKYLNIFVTSILIFCIPGFLNFRDHCISKQLYVFSTDSFIWSLVGFICIFVPAILSRSPNTLGSTWWGTRLSRSSIRSTRARKGPTSIDRWWNSPSILSSIRSWLFWPTLFSVTNTGSLQWLEVVDLAPCSIKTIRIGRQDRAPNYRCTLWSSWGSISFRSSRWWSSRGRPSASSMRWLYITPLPHPWFSSPPWATRSFLAPWSSSFMTPAIFWLPSPASSWRPSTPLQEW